MGTDVVGQLIIKTKYFAFFFVSYSERCLVLLGVCVYYYLSPSGIFINRTDVYKVFEVLS